MLKKEPLKWAGLIVLIILAAVVVWFRRQGPVADPVNQPTTATIWQEAEDYDNPVARNHRFPWRRAPASNGITLNPERIDEPGESIEYSLTISEPVADAQVVFRFARLPWGEQIPPGQFSVELRGNGKTIRREVAFGDTGGWGRKPDHWRLKRVALDDLSEGAWTLRLSPANRFAKVVLDGFWICPSTLVVSAEETTDLGRIRCTDRGWFGLQRGDAVINQVSGRPLNVVGRCFDGRKLKVAAAVEGLRDPPAATKLPRGSLAPGERVELKPNGHDSRHDNGIRTVGFTVPAVDDGVYTLLLSAEHPQGKLETSVVMFGHRLLTDLDASLEKLERYKQRLAAPGAAAAGQCLADFQHAIGYLKHNRQLLSDYTYDIETIVRNTRRVIDQYDETMQRLEAGQAPYAGRTGDLRRAMLIDGKIMPYRVFVPSGYAKAEKIPLVVMIHGGGETEDIWPDMGDGVALKALQERGYLMIAPRRWPEDETYEKLFELLTALVDREYPKVDRRRIFLAGHSRGGYASYELAARHPGKFRAIACISGVTDPKWAKHLKGTPVLLAHGEKDTTVDPEKTRRVAAELKRLGYEYELYLYPDRDHALREHASQYVKLVLDFFDKYR
ncbi:MAG: alpha/beta fold hydrolase [Anaerolineaceae bacterium]|nr:alpha/beta fold hydrolase [Anaerolineaceae bacterium]